jgi:hypothetical protein
MGNNKKVTPMTLRRCIRVFSLAALLIIVPAGVFAQDVGAMAKWTALTVVHYGVAGEYSAETPLLADGRITRTPLR